MLTSFEALSIYGTPNETGKGYLKTFKSPFPLYPVWEKNGVKTDYITCHQSIVEPLSAVLSDILKTYGLSKIHELGIDRYGGCFSYRKQTNGSTLSLHSWGLAIDLDPVRNLYHESSKTARFARPEYKQMIDIFYRHGFESLGREKNFDWMHFQISKNFNPAVVKK